MSSPQHYYGSLSSGRAVSPPPESRPPLDTNRGDTSGDHPASTGPDAARQMSKARSGQDPSPPRGSTQTIRPSLTSTRSQQEPCRRPVRTPAPPSSSAAAARFYQHNRNGSNTSLDSQHHFIDHRHQPILISNVHSPSALRGRSALSRTPMRSPNTYFPTRANEHALIDDDEDEFDGETSISLVWAKHVRRSSHRSHSVHSREHDQEVDEEAHFRRGSIAEDDVCFPHMHDRRDVLARHTQSTFATMSVAPSLLVLTTRHALGYPFTFDLNALEDFASEERERIGLASSWNAAGSPDQGLRQRGAAAPKAAGGP